MQLRGTKKLTSPKPPKKPRRPAPPRFCAYCGMRLRRGQARAEVDLVTGIVIYRHRRPCTNWPEQVQ